MNIYKVAMDIQDACNLSGVIGMWERLRDDIWTDVREHGGGTREFNNHPVNVMFASKVSAMTGAEITQHFGIAYDACMTRQYEQVS